MTRVALLGTGRMGSAMARALASAGHELVLHNRTARTAEALAEELGAKVAAVPADAVRDAEVVITMLADDAAVEDTYRRREGVLDGIRDGAVALEMSTVEPGVSRALAPDVAAAGGCLLDAPVSGSVAFAEQGKLTVMVGGDASALERARPVLDALAERVFHVGAIGSGAATKLAVNAVIFAIDVAVSEALVLAERAGVDRETVYDVLQAGAAGAPVVHYKRAHFLQPESAPVGFSLDLAAKDLRLIAGLAERVGLPVAQVHTNLALIEQAAASQGGDRDFASVATHLRAAAGDTGAEEGSRD